MATSGSVAYMFKRKAVFALPREGIDEDSLMELALELGADDVTTDDPEIFGIEADQDLFHALATAFMEKGWDPLDAALRYVPDNYVEVDAAAGEKLLALIDAIEDDDEVKTVHHNGEIPL